MVRGLLAWYGDVMCLSSMMTVNMEGYVKRFNIPMKDLLDFITLELRLLMVLACSVRRKSHALDSPST